MAATCQALGRLADAVAGLGQAEAAARRARFEHLYTGELSPGRHCHSTLPLTAIP
jgi:hypothetical protein